PSDRGDQTKSGGRGSWRGAPARSGGRHRLPGGTGRLRLPDGADRCSPPRNDSPAFGDRGDGAGLTDLRKRAMTQTFALYVDDKAGVLNRVVSLFRRRMLNIESLTAGRSEIPGVSRMTVVVDTDEYGAHRLAANLNKLMAVRRVDRLASESSISTELAIIKVAMPEDARTEVNRFLDAHRARIVSAHPDRLV